MPEYSARLAQAASCKVRDLRRPKSFFDLLRKEFGQTASLSTPLHRVCSLARRLGVTTVVIEELEKAGEITEENEDLSKLKVWHGGPPVLRISFFSQPFSEPADIPNQPQTSFIGYALWKCDYTTRSQRKASGRVYEAVMPPPDHAYIHIRGGVSWRCRVQDHFFTAHGYPFFQQNALTNVCSHAALRTIAACFSPEDQVLTFRQMNDMLAKQPEDISNGLLTHEIASLLETTGAEISVYAYNDLALPVNKVPYQRLAYGSLESGYPAMLIFGDSTLRETAETEMFLHAVPVFGHTFNPDMWLPHVERARFNLGRTLGFIPSDFWLGSLIGHDDNFGPHYSIPRHYLRSMRSAAMEHPQSMSTEGVAWLLTTLPKGVRLRSVEAEPICTSVLQLRTQELKKHQEIWTKRLLENLAERQLVLRSLLLTKDQYEKHLKSIEGWDEKEKLSPENIQAILDTIPLDLFWMVEISLLELFPTNRRKVGEMIIDPREPGAKMTHVQVEKSGLGLRLPGQWTSWPQDGVRRARPLPLTLTSHCPLYGCEQAEKEAIPQI
ncbi:hypothetical protein WJU23_19075 [Prosthecobacter sp. SYSU 5D2]|uniref:hypothetical protein n=1 Tax=Prosthecobacter sp. SYSU 5D2 TaxID=3134134 RepID=UPI0031FEE9F9